MSEQYEEPKAELIGSPDDVLSVWIEQLDEAIPKPEGDNDQYISLAELDDQEELGYDISAALELFTFNYTCTALTSLHQSGALPHRDLRHKLINSALSAQGNADAYGHESILLMPTNQDLEVVVQRSQEPLDSDDSEMQLSLQVVGRHLADRDPRSLQYDTPQIEAVRALAESISRVTRAIHTITQPNTRVELRINANNKALPGKELAVIEQPEAQPAQTPQFEDFGGIDDVITALEDVINVIKHPELTAKYNLKPTKGVLLKGPGGLGKTGLSEAFAARLNAEYVYVSVGEVLTKWVGDPVQKLVELYDKAATKEGNVVIFFDELDGLFSTDAGGNSGVITSLVAQFKTILTDPQRKYPNVITLAAANSTANIDPILLRAGRFDTVVEFTKPDTNAMAQIYGKMLAKLSGHFDLSDSIDSYDIVDAVLVSSQVKRENINIDELAQVSAGFTGADIDSVLQALLKKRMLDELRLEGTQPPLITQSAIIEAILTHKKQRPTEFTTD